MAANEPLNQQESLHVSLNTSDSRQLFAESQQKEQPKNLSAYKAAPGVFESGRPQDLQSSSAGMKANYRAKNEQDPFQLNGKQIVQGNMIMQRADYDNDSQSECLHPSEANPYNNTSPINRRQTRDYEDKAQRLAEESGERKGSR